ncbi:MAG: GNAT family N-acetyltransferase, partial [Pseudolabrys sp.]
MPLTEIFQFLPNLASSGLTVRNSGPADVHFFRALYATARIDVELLATLPVSQREPFLDDQFRLQDTHYRRHYGGADFLVVEQDSKPVGRLILDRTTPAWQIVDIALVPALRGKGIGGELLRTILEAAVRSG